jgi:Rieske Fe-S protein
MERRGFIKFCAASAAAIGAPAVGADARVQLYSRARLVDEKGQPLRAAAIPVNRNLIFHYPFAATPCFLLNLGKTVKPTQLKTVAGAAYEWKGGVGAGRSVVAYSAICAHRLAYPTEDSSLSGCRSVWGARDRFAYVIRGCSVLSGYDPAEGARVVAGPAPQPLASILLEWDSAKDEIHAVGTLGGEMFGEFFDKFAFRLQLEHGDSARSAVSGSCVVQELDHYCRQQVKC